MTAEDVLLTGLPRSGTTLTCHLLNKCPGTVALHEPLNVAAVGRLPTADERLAAIRTFFADTRAGLRRDGCATSKHEGGSVPDNHVHEAPDGSRTTDRIGMGAVHFPHAGLDPLVVVKHPAFFTGMLPELVGRLPVYAVVRNPLSVLASWSSVPMNVRDGHAPAAERVAPDLATLLARQPDALTRQLHLLSWFFEQYLRYLPPEAVLRYEQVVASGGRALAAITPAAAALDVPLTSKNGNSAYGSGMLARLGAYLLDTDGAYWRFYDRDDVRVLLEADVDGQPKA